MSTSFRISQTRVGEPKSGFIGALVGGNDPGDSIDIIAETDELNDIGDIVNFIQDVAGSVSGAYIRIVGEPEGLIEAEVVDDDEPEDEEL